MDIFEIEGPVQLSGSIDIAGSKNSTLPVMAAMLLAGGKSTIPNAPDLSDIRSLETLLESLGAAVNRDADGLHIDAAVIDNPVGEYEIVRKMRASICILGPLLARCGRVKVSMPGGCAIGDR
ncbi:MAG: UDP-N-acetylglucosamine 1-carboxyvinyltransferase, partial [Planctomycetota bacterium]